MKTNEPVSDRLVRHLQWAWLSVAFVLVGGIIVLILHLISTAWTLADNLSASVGISIVAIPIFFTFMGVVFYVFWGLSHSGSDK